MRMICGEEYQYKTQSVKVTALRARSPHSRTQNSKIIIGRAGASPHRGSSTAKIMMYPVNFQYLCSICTPPPPHHSATSRESNRERSVTNTIDHLIDGHSWKKCQNKTRPSSPIPAEAMSFVGCQNEQRRGGGSDSFFSLKIDVGERREAGRGDTTDNRECRFGKIKRTRRTWEEECGLITRCLKTVSSRTTNETVWRCFLRAAKSQTSHCVSELVLTPADKWLLIAQGENNDVTQSDVNDDNQNKIALRGNGMLSVWWSSSLHCRHMC